MLRSDPLHTTTHSVYVLGVKQHHPGDRKFPGLSETLWNYLEQSLRLYLERPLGLLELSRRLTWNSAFGALGTARSAYGTATCGPGALTRVRLLRNNLNV